MKRRHFLQRMLAGTAALVAGPALIRAQAVEANGPGRFASALAREPWLAGWRTVGRQTLGPTAATLQGKLPEGLEGVLYRNGPAWFDRDGMRYQHWFDGDGMVHAWRIGRGRVQHQASMVATSKFVREQKEGRFVVPAAGTAVPDSLPIRNNDDMNTANTAVIKIDGRLFALWEGGSAIEIDPDTLATRGPVTWREDLTAAP